MPKKVTIHDVARHAGVSHTTVSWALHDDPRITDETKQKVLASVEALDYFPAFLGRSLVSGRSKTIAVVAASFSSSFEMDLMRGIEEAMDREESEYSVQLFSTRRDKNSKLKTFQKILQGRRADAVISVNLKPGHTFIEDFKDSGVALVLVEDSFDGVSTVYCDSKSGTELAIDHLIERGCRKPGILVGLHDDPDGGLSPRIRYETYVERLKHHGIEARDEWIVEIPQYHPENGIESLEAFVKAGCDGIFCAAGDMVAVGLVKAAKERGVAIPDELKIIGYDDVAFSSLITPALTTIHQPIVEIGRMAYELASKGIDAEQDQIWHSETIVLQPQLVIRDST
jgi:LacI family transcriptional regulator